MGFASDVKTYQTFFNIFGYSARALDGGLLAEDGKNGDVTKKVTEKFQEIKGIVKDGVIGNQTRKEMVKDIQRFMNDKGISKAAIGSNLSVDGVDGPVTDKVILKLQSLKGLKQDKILGIVTLTALAYYNTTSGNIGSTGWARLIYTRDSQDTNYTCGPSSLKMALSVYGLNYSETTLKTLVGAKEKIGTSNEGIVNAVNNLGKGLKARNETFKDWETLRGYLVKGFPVMLRVSSWLTPGGEHYIVLVGLNIEKGLVELGDPSAGGYRATTTTDLLARIKKVSVPSVILISK